MRGRRQHHLRCLGSKQGAPCRYSPPAPPQAAWRRRPADSPPHFGPSLPPLPQQQWSRAPVQCAGAPPPPRTASALRQWTPAAAGCAQPACGLHRSCAASPAWRSHFDGRGRQWGQSTLLASRVRGNCVTCAATCITHRSHPTRACCSAAASVNSAHLLCRPKQEQRMGT
jgi:hypothetical protein